MLPAYIIEKLKELEIQRQSSFVQPRLELPLPPNDWTGPQPEMGNMPLRGVVIVSVWDDE